MQSLQMLLARSHCSTIEVCILHARTHKEQAAAVAAAAAASVVSVRFFFISQ